MTPTILHDHIVHKSGQVKTVCVTACLTALGVPVESFKYTGSIADNRREAILRKHGYAVRSRMSKLPSRPTMGKVRTAIKTKMNDPAGTRYLVIQRGVSYCHCVLLNAQGETIVDTAPRKRDKRKVISIKAVFPKGLTA